MPKTPKSSPISEVTVESFRGFQALITDRFNDTRRYVWRGQQCSNWNLESTLARRIREKEKKPPTKRALNTQLRRFKQAARGRRGTNPAKLEDSEWWALGQHFGLATPLLDWTLSPYVALYFAFADPEHKAQTPHRVVCGIHRPMIQDRTQTIEDPLQPDNGIDFFEPDSDENSRVLSQRGLFTISPVRTTIENWVVENFENPSADVLIKIHVPNEDREDCLRMLNRMNINHLTLFPDLIGAAVFCNVHMDVINY